ncbi:hypothetical protein L7F22_012795 [Adiantum nelumboides]|nr:hypothetical protein [Adiantum nelumboides]
MSSQRPSLHRLDTAGQERYKSLAPMYYRNANCAVVVYDITQPSSLEKAKSWIRELQRQADPNIIIALAGNKADLASTRRAIPTEEAQAYADEEGLLFLETSAKDASNVSELFTMIARKLPLEQAAGAQRAGGARVAATCSLPVDKDPNATPSRKTLLFCHCEALSLLFIPAAQ